LIQAGIQLLTSLIKNLPTIIVEIVKAVPQIIAGIVKAFTGSISQIVQVGGNLIKGLWQGISDAGAWLWNKISGFFGGVVDKIKNFFGIHSPSTLFAGLGANMGEGIGVGFEKAMAQVGDDMQNAIPTDFDMPGVDMNVNGTSGAVMGGLGGSLITIQQMIVRSEDDIRRISQELYNLMQTGSRAQGRFNPA
jgi:phage-related protein